MIECDDWFVCHCDFDLWRRNQLMADERASFHLFLEGGPPEGTDYLHEKGLDSVDMKSKKNEGE